MMRFIFSAINKWPRDIWGPRLSPAAAVHPHTCGQHPPLHQAGGVTFRKILTEISTSSWHSRCVMNSCDELLGFLILHKCDHIYNESWAMENHTSLFPWAYSPQENIIHYRIKKAEWVVESLTKLIWQQPQCCCCCCCCRQEWPRWIKRDSAPRVDWAGRGETRAGAN